MDKRFLSIDDLTSLPKPTWMIEGLFEANSTVMLAGPPGSYKSFLALDWMMCCASGRTWNTRKTLEARTLYVLGEGRANLLKRIQVWDHYHKLNDEEIVKLHKNFRVTFDVPQMGSKASVDNMLAGLAAEKYDPQLIVVDTFQRSFVGLDENSAQDTGLWIESAERLRALGYTVLFLHHTKKNTEFGLQYRGSTGILGAMDTALTMQRDGSANRVKVEVSKQKDHDEGDPMYFERLIVQPDPREEGSVILVPTKSLDERFTLEGKKIEDSIVELIQDPTFESDRGRARELAFQYGIGETAAQSRISRKRREMGMPHLASVSASPVTAEIIEFNRS